MDFCIDGKILPTNLSCRDLGVIVSHDLKPAMHIGQIMMVAKAHQRANKCTYCIVFTARRYASAVLAVVVCPSVRLSVCLSVRLSVRLSQDGIVSKRQHIESRKQRRTVAQGI